MSTDEFRALVCMTTCDRMPYLLRTLPHLAAFCGVDRRFSLLVALDGNDPGYLEFCDHWQVPLLYSDRREGVGLSKNRVLKAFPDFDYYFFVEDDAELVDPSVFPLHVKVSRASGIHHFSLFERGGLRKRIGASWGGGNRISHGLYGGAPFNFFTREGLRRVGGWHPAFARYRRWGHTEHSHRFPRVGLAPAPFNVLEDMADALIWHNPPSVTPHHSMIVDEDQLTLPEREIMQEELEHVPVETISPFHFNGHGFECVKRLANEPSRAERYPLLRGRERRRAHADWSLWMAKTGDRLASRVGSLVRSAVSWPSNPALKHHLKKLIRS